MSGHFSSDKFYVSHKFIIDKTYENDINTEFDIYLYKMVTGEGGIYKNLGCYSLRDAFLYLQSLNKSLGTTDEECYKKTLTDMSMYIRTGNNVIGILYKDLEIDTEQFIKDNNLKLVYK